MCTVHNVPAQVVCVYEQMGVHVGQSVHGLCCGMHDFVMCEKIVAIFEISVLILPQIE